MVIEPPDVVYICRPGETNEELRYSLRSLHNLTYRTCWIVGDCPSWVDPRTTSIIRTRSTGSVFDITARNIARACEDDRISDPFVLFNDDFYVIEPVKRVPVLNRGPLTKVLAHYEAVSPRSSYTVGMRQTFESLLDTFDAADLLSFELHVPLPVYKVAMLAALERRGSIHRYHNRTVYGALAGLEGRTIPDPKVYDVDDLTMLDEPGPWLSTSDSTFKLVLPYLARRFPRRSPYELG